MKKVKLKSKWLKSMADIAYYNATKYDNLWVVLARERRLAKNNKKST